jgi:long-chain acyl-CoA synthetase
MLVHQLLSQSAARTPDAISLIEPRRQVTYGELDRLVNRFANLFVASGVQRGDRVLVALENSIELVGAYFGAARAGGVAVPLPAGPRSDRLARAVVDCAPRVCVIDPATELEVTPEHPLVQVPAVFVHRGRAGGRFADLSTSIAASGDAPPDVRAIDVDLAAIIYTSGSTGEPRGVMLSHRNIVANTRSIVSYLGLTAADRVMCVLPFYYVYGLSLLHTHIAVGGSVAIDNRFAFPNVVLDAMREHSVTGFAGVPSTFALLLHRSNLTEMSVPSLRYVTQAGGSMPAPRILEWLERGPQVPFFVMYGATEASARLTYLPPADLRAKLGSIGRPIPNVDITIIKDDGSVAAPGEIGELVARGLNIACGYWNVPSETREKFGPQGYRTGDLGYQDADGYLYLVGRRHDTIKVGAQRVGAKEIEDVLHEHAGVLDAAVVGVPHEILGEAPIAAVVMRPGHAGDAEALRVFCRQFLAAHKVPVRFCFMTDLPKTRGVGKIDKNAVRRAVEQQAEVFRGPA